MLMHSRADRTTAWTTLPLNNYFEGGQTASEGRGVQQGRAEGQAEGRGRAGEVSERGSRCSTLWLARHGSQEGCCTSSSTLRHKAGGDALDATGARA